MRFYARIAEETGFRLIRFRQAKRAGAGHFNAMRREQCRHFAKLSGVVGGDDNLLSA
jgi:hypothetical protein